MQIRIAKPDDAASLLRIYSPFILNSGITQEIEIPSVDEFGSRIITTLKERPWLVCEMDSEIAGYAYAGKHRERKGYQWCTEPSVYVAEKFYRKGVANALYTALFDILRLQRYINAYAVITLPNEKSVAFHEKFGFTYLATYRKIGYKLGQWHDVGWWELKLNPHVPAPAEPIKFPESDSSLVEKILQDALQKLRQ
jgi:phosphinothricin acetyltransferase